MPGLLLDTHSAVWYLARSPRLAVNARRAILNVIAAGHTVFVATISLVEIRYLVERARLPEDAFTTLEQALSDPGIALEPAPLDVKVARALSRVPRADVPDMPDRIIAATALALNAPLVTRDARIRASVVPTVW